MIVWCYNVILNWSLFSFVTFGEYGSHKRTENSFELMYGMSWYDSLILEVTERKTFFCSFQSLIVLCLAANNIFTITSRFSCTHDHRIYILMLMAHFFGWTKRNVLFTSVFQCLHVRSFFFAYDNKIRLPKHLFQRIQSQQENRYIYMIIKILLIRRYANRKLYQMSKSYKQFWIPRNRWCV